MSKSDLRSFEEWLHAHLNPPPFDKRIGFILENYQTFGRDLWEKLFGILAQCVDTPPSWDLLQSSSNDESLRFFLAYWRDLPSRAQWYAICLIERSQENL